ncbi:hypothetical protein [Arcicella rigui]|uniref:Uncharacterized protein n=1 Tax=Arcicella rigui TaxID=797020 RepID=A0ABU5QDI6_9BACT|nr:hypothetical protein [Arcicella rigui]MEA5140911.1 hypothetical protein [Arcicella rigui]
MYIEALIADLEKKLSFLLSGKFWIWKIIFVSVFLFVVVDFSGNPSKLIYYRDFYDNEFVKGELDSTHAIIREQSIDYFAFFRSGKDASIPSYKHEAKLKFRLFLPTLVRIFGQKHFAAWLYGLAIALGFLYLYLITKVVIKILGEKENRLLIFFFIAGFANLYAGAGSFILDISPYGDFFAFLFLLLSVYFKNPLLIFGFCQLAFWVDERALVNAIFVIIWWTFSILPDKDLKFKISTQALATAISGIFYLGVRWYLTTSYKLYDTIYIGEFISTFYENIKMLSLRVWFGFDGMWLLILLGLVILYREKHYFLLTALAGSLIGTIAFAFIAYDVNRGMSYSYLAILLSLMICKKYLSEKELKYLLLICFIVSVLTPTLNKFRVVGGWQFM